MSKEIIMNKIFRLMAAVVCVAISSLLIFSACGKVESALVSYNLNGGAFTDTFKAENGIKSDKLSTAVNLKYYGGFSDGMPDERDLEAPDGKVFAGWYLDKECTAENYLTSQTWEILAQNIRDKKGGTIYARWIDKGQKDILYELDGETFSFKETTSKIMRFTCTSETFASQKENLPTVDDVDAVGKKEFSSWAVECNGHYYDFAEHAYKVNATNKYCSNVNSGFDSTTFADFLADTNVSYVLLRPGIKTDKPARTIILDMSEGDVHIVHSFDLETRNKSYNSTYLFGTVGIGKTGTAETGETYYTELSLSVIYDIKFSDLNGLLPSGDNLTASANGKVWKFKVGDGTAQEFNETNWNEIRSTRPTETTENITFVLV